MMIDSGMVCEALRRRGERERKARQWRDALLLVAGLLVLAAVDVMMAASLFSAILWGRR